MAQAWGGPRALPTFSSSFYPNNPSAINGFTTAEVDSLPFQFTEDGRYVPTVLQNQQLAFGLDRRKDLTDPQALEHRVNKVFSDTYGPGASRFMEQLLIMNILSSQQRLLDWCPITRNPHGPHIKWRRTIFHHAMADPIPEQGVARVVTQSYEEWENYSARIGLAFQMEDGFKMTPAGQRDYVCHLAQLTNAFVTYGLLDIIMSLITQAKPWIDEVLLYGGKYNSNEWRQRLDSETAIHGVISKSTDPGNAIKYYAQRIAEERNRNFTAVINSSGMRALFDAKDRHHQDYTTQGPRAYQYQDGTRNEMDKIPMKEYETSRYPIGPDGTWTDPLKHPCVTVSYHQMEQVDYSSPENYRTANDCVILLDHKVDSLFKITIKQMLDNCGLFGENGAITPQGAGFFKFRNVKGREDTANQTNSFGDYLRYNGIFRALNQASNLALARARKTNDVASLQEFARLWRLEQPALVNRARARAFNARVFPNQARHQADTAKERAALAKRQITELSQAGGAQGQAYADLLALIPRFRTPTLQYNAIENDVDRFVTAVRNPDPSVLEFFEALVELLSPTMQRGQYNALFEVRRRLAGRNAELGADIADANVDNEIVFGEKEIGEMFDNTMIEDLTLKHFEWFAANDVQIPLRFAIIRFVYDIMGMMIVGIPGSSTGNLCLGDGNFQLSHNGSQKMLYGFAHIWIGCVINDVENIALLPNVRAVAYLRGGSKEMWNPHTDAADYRAGSPLRIKDNFTFPMMPCEVLEDNFDLTGHNPETITSEEAPQYAAMTLMTSLWGWLRPHTPFVDRNVFSPMAMPTRAFRGCTYYPDASKGSNSVAKVQYGKGHWPVMFAGAVAIRNGVGDQLLLEKPKGLIELADIVSYDYHLGQ